MIRGVQTSVLMEEEQWSSRRRHGPFTEDQYYVSEEGKHLKSAVGGQYEGKTGANGSGSHSLNVYSNGSGRTDSLGASQHDQDGRRSGVFVDDEVKDLLEVPSVRELTMFMLPVSDTFTLCCSFLEVFEPFLREFESF